ncbi:potassium channel family protein [Dermatobacter hominis]|uniref:potassium channel family protein n=1 Tax=Dermatobacter hominis TaxID=2884263 RepID=UPI001D1290A5|nr:potassium channel family protein [Dermatobacter hominis]UDY36743.1 potassium channel family protein [Dermatobacter hominis]
MEEETTASYLSPQLVAWRRVTDLPLTILAIGSLPLLFLELKRADLAYHDRLFLDVVNVAVLVAFAADYGVELFVSSDRRAYVRGEWAGGLIVLTQALAVVPAMSFLGVTRAARAAPVIRAVTMIARVIAVGGVAAREGRSVLRQHAAAFALGLAGFTWIMSAALFTMFEDVGPGHRVGSFFDGLWWSLATVTTVGYGDVAPVTTMGRIVGGFTMVVGVSTFAIITAKVAEFLMRADLVRRPVDLARETDAADE